MRALRVDKMTLAALEATLRLALDPALGARRIPLWSFLNAPLDSLRDRAERLAESFRDRLGLDASVDRNDRLPRRRQRPGRTAADGRRPRRAPFPARLDFRRRPGPAPCGTATRRSSPGSKGGRPVRPPGESTPPTTTTACSRPSPGGVAAPRPARYRDAARSRRTTTPIEDPGARDMRLCRFSLDDLTLTGFFADDRVIPIDQAAEAYCRRPRAPSSTCPRPTTCSTCSPPTAPRSPPRRPWPTGSRGSTTTRSTNSRSRSATSACSSRSAARARSCSWPATTPRTSPSGAGRPPSGRRRSPTSS